MAKHTKFIVRVSVWEYTFLQPDDDEPAETDLIEYLLVARHPDYSKASAIAAHTANLGRVLSTPQIVPL